MTLSKTIASLFVPVLALSVFVNQLYRQSAYDLSAWKGGGMGMFASADAPAFRFARVIATNEGGSIHLGCFPAALNDLAVSATHEPSEQNLSDLARAVLAERWYLHETPAPPSQTPPASMRYRPPAADRYCPYPRPGGLGDQPLRFDAVRVAVYKLAYDRATNTLAAIETATLDHVRTPGR